MTIARWFPLALLCTVTLTYAQGLAWESKTVEFKPKAGDTETTAEFRFTNAGKQDVTIKRIRTSCGCTQAKTDHEVYAPGAKGTLSVTFRFEGRTGQQMKTIFVTTDDPDEPTTALQLTGMLPWNVQLSQGLLLWPVNGDPKPQEVLVELNPGLDIALLKVDIDSKDFSCTIEPTDTPRQYRLVFTPAATATRTRAIASLVTRPELNKAELARARIFLYVR